MMWPTLEHTVENFSVAAPLDNNPLVLGTPAWVNNSLVMLLAGLLSKIIDFEFSNGKLFGSHLNFISIQSGNWFWSKNHQWNVWQRLDLYAEIMNSNSNNYSFQGNFFLTSKIFLFFTSHMKLDSLDLVLNHILQSRFFAPLMEMKWVIASGKWRAWSPALL